MKILLIGSGGREHALAWRLRQDDSGIQLFTAPGNAGTGQLGTNLAYQLPPIRWPRHSLGDAAKKPTWTDCQVRKRRFAPV